MKFLANENFPMASVRLLRASGIDIVTILEMERGIYDAEVMGIAAVQERTILTFDSDYGTLIFRHGYKSKQGVIYFRWENYAPTDPGKMLLRLIEAGEIDFSNALTVIDENSIRQRKY